MGALETVLLIAAVVLQVVAAILAVRALPHSGRYGSLWIALSLALVLMVERRVAPLFHADGSAMHVADATLGLVISALLVFSLLGLSRLLLAVRENQRQLVRLAVTDPLTGLANRRHVLAELEKEWRRVERTRQPLSVLMVDIDHFKSINDRYGHAVGDEVLVAMAKRCKSRLRAIDQCGRIGGEEFVVLLPETGAEGAAIAAERLRAGVSAAPVDSAGGLVRVTVSVGVAVHDPRGRDREPGLRDGETRPAQALLQRADRALYRAKAAGRDRVHLDAPSPAKEASTP